LGLTVSCARCHDHKFDPISSKDYYALHGVFASSEEPAELPLLGPLRESDEYQEFLKKKAAFQVEIEQFKDRRSTNSWRIHSSAITSWALAMQAIRDPSPRPSPANANSTLTCPTLDRISIPRERPGAGTLAQVEQTA
jgi:hypothetical protein